MQFRAAGSILHRCTRRPPGKQHAVSVTLDVTHKQIGQLCREWYGIVDVIDVRSSVASVEHGHRSSGRRFRQLRQHFRAVGARVLGIEFEFDRVKSVMPPG